MRQVGDKSIELVVTSPPYPMIEMWDEIMGLQNQEIDTALASRDGLLAFELMHQELDKVWKEVERVLIPGGFVCVNIGDATRTIGKEFALYPNHSRVISAFHKLGFTNLPNIIWRKQTNAPNKFMGSGMLPAGAYVTLEHEYILIFRKGGKRAFVSEVDKTRRRESAFFWEERNTWFSDTWDLKGVKQNLGGETRSRSGAFPIEIPLRLINMYSLQGDTVLDPFLGTGKTSVASMALGRNSVGYEIDDSFQDIIFEGLEKFDTNTMIQNRIAKHKEFISARANDPSKGVIKHFHSNMEVPVMTSQETEIKLWLAKDKSRSENKLSVSYI